jgi:hypothetical protein
MASLEETFAQRQNESASQVNNLYDNQNKAQAAGLKAEYDKNMSDARAAAGSIAPQYQNQANALAHSYEVNRRNANLNGMVSGLGSGTAQQQQNALQNQYLANYGALRGQEAGAVNEANQKMADLTTAYNNALVQSQNEGNAKRDQELIKAYNTNRDWYEAQAQNMAQNYGQFGSLKDIYGQAQADQMRNVWIAQNPEVAFRSGMISADEYRNLTNKAPTWSYQSIYD